jgi:heptosyltransferase-2
VPPVTDIKRILVVTKYRFIGDTLLSIPALRAASETWPDAKITLLTGANALQMLQNCPFVHDPIEFDPYRKADKGIPKFLSIVGAVRSRKFDLALILNRSFHSSLIATMGGARQRVGWAGFAGRDFMLTDTCAYRTDDSEVDCYVDIVKRAAEVTGARWPANEAVETRLWLSDDEVASAREYLAGGTTFIAMQPGASHEYKRWPVERFAAVADSVASPNTKLVLIGGPGEADDAARMLALCSPDTRDRTINLTGSLKLRETAAVLAQVDAFLANDTGIRHVAMAVDTPTVGMFGPTSAAKWGNAHPPRHSVLVAPGGSMDEISVSDVRDAVNTAVSQRSKATS